MIDLLFIVIFKDVSNLSNTIKYINREIICIEGIVALLIVI